MNHADDPVRQARCARTPQRAAVFIALALVVGLASAMTEPGAGPGGGPPGGDRPPQRSVAEQLKDKARRLASKVRGIRITPESKGDEKAAREAMREMQMLYQGPITRSRDAYTEAKDGGKEPAGSRGVEGVVVPGLGVAGDEQALVGPALAAAHVPPGPVVPPALPGAGQVPHGAPVSPPPPPEPEVVEGVHREVTVAVPVPMMRWNGSVPLDFNPSLPAGVQGPPAPVEWGVPIFGFAVDARNASAPQVPVFAVPLAWLDGLDAIAADMAVAINRLTGTYLREGIMYTHRGGARLYLTRPTGLALRERPKGGPHEKYD